MALPMGLNVAPHHVAGIVAIAALAGIATFLTFLMLTIERDNDATNKKHVHVYARFPTIS